MCTHDALEFSYGFLFFLSRLTSSIQIRAVKCKLTNFHRDFILSTNLSHSSISPHNPLYTQQQNMAAAQENRGRLMQHYKYLSDYLSENEYISNPECKSADESPLGNYRHTARGSDKKIVGVRVEFSNFEYTINKRKDDIQTETRKLF